LIAVPAGVRVMVATKPIDFRRGADGLVALVRETLGQDPFLEASRPGEDCGLGRIWSGSILEASGARCIPMAAGQRWRDAANVSATGCIDRRHGLVASGSTRCKTTDRNVVRRCDLSNQDANYVSQ
jgi:IS66 Orf2 like protein